MRINAHAHGMHAERDEKDEFRPPLMPIWKPDDPDDGIRCCRASGIKKIVLLDPADIAFALAEWLPDFSVPAPQVNADKTTPEQINDPFSRGAHAIRFIAPVHSYGDNRYFPLYDTIRTLAAFILSADR